MPLGREASRAWLDGQETADRANARMIDKVRLALPLELDEAQRVQLVQDFAAEVGRGRIPWLAGIHDRDKDAGNPHAHVIFRDRDFETGKRVVQFSEKGSTERLRETWELVANQALERAGSAARIDRRSLEAQGIDRQPGIHVGPNVLAMEERGVRPRSRPQVTVNGRVIDWPGIDQGRTRLDRQAEIEAANENRTKAHNSRGTEQAALPAAGGAGQEPPRAPGAQAPATGDREGAASAPEAPQLPSGAAEAEGRRPVAADHPVDRAADVSRLRQAIERARERLEALGTRLEAAFSRIRERFLEQDRQRSPPAKAASPAPAPPPGKPRRTLDAYRRDWGRGRDGPER